MDVAITGSSGLIGTALGASLRADGHTVVPVLRRPPAAGGATDRWVAWDPAAGTIDAAGLEGIDAVVHLAGAGIGDHRWSDAHRRLVLDSRVQGTTLLARTLTGLDRPPAVLVSGSAIGYYGDRGDEVLTEASGPGSLYLSEVCTAWEAAAGPAVDAGIRVAFARTGIVLSPRGGALGKLRTLFKFGLGGRQGSGRQWMSWIGLDDEVAALRFLLDHDLAGPVNLVAPEPVTNADFARTLGSVMHRPALFPAPAFGLHLVLGRQMADELLLASQRVRPAALEGAGFSFTHPDLAGCLAAVA